MYSYYFKICGFLFSLFLSANYLYAHEIYLKEGKIIEVKSYWEENNVVCYEKFGAVIKIPKSDIKKIECTTEAETKDVLNNELAIDDINSTEELKTIKKQCKVLCEEEYDKCAYRCLENTEQNGNFDTDRVKNCKSECRFQAKICKLVCKDEFMMNNLALLKHEYRISEKPVGEIYYSSGFSRNYLLEQDKKRIQYLEKKMKAVKSRGQQYYENRNKNIKKSNHSYKPALFMYNSDIYFLEIDLIEAKKEYDLHLYGRGLTGVEYDCYKNNFRCNQLE